MLELASADTYSVPGRGTVKVVVADRETRRRIYAAAQDRAVVSIDREGWLISTIEEHSHAAAIKRLCLQVRRPT